MSSSAQLGRQPITMLSRALPQGWKELNTCWLSTLSLCLCLWVPLSPTHWLLLSLYFVFASLLLFSFLLLSFCLLLPRLFSPFFFFFSSLHLFIHSVKYPPPQALSISFLICRIQSVFLSFKPKLRHTHCLSICLSSSFLFFSLSVSDTHTHTTFQWALWCHCSGACGSKRGREGWFLKWQGWKRGVCVYVYRNDRGGKPDSWCTCADRIWHGTAARQGQEAANMMWHARRFYWMQLSTLQSDCLEWPFCYWALRWRRRATVDA